MKYATRFVEKMRKIADKVGELVICATGDKAIKLAEQYADSYNRVDILYFEQGWHNIIELASHDWILQLDDDEELSPALEDWLVRGDWQQQPYDGFVFPTAWLFGDEQHYLTNYPVGGDSHTRLLKKEYSAREAVPHSVPQAYRRAIVPYLLYHHKFLVRTIEQRVATARKYELLMENGGFGKRMAYNVPEVVFKNYDLREVGDGRIERWRLRDYIR